MSDRERLLAILKIPIYPHECVDPVEAVADFLLDYGVKVPVMCKECKHYGKGVPYTAKLLPFRWCKKFCNITNPDDFCSYGEGRNDG